MSVETAIPVNLFTHTFGQSSAKKLVESGEGDCFAYAKFCLYRNPEYLLYLQSDNMSGVHFGAVDASTTDPVLHHLRSVHPSEKQMMLDEALTTKFYSSDRVLYATRPASFTPEKIYRAVDAKTDADCIIVTEEPMLYLEYFAQRLVDNDVWDSALKAAGDHEGSGLGPLS